MGGVFQVKVRKIGSSVGVLLPKGQIENIGADVGDKVEIALLKHRRKADIERGFGLARDFKEDFLRDKRTREF